MKIKTVLSFLLIICTVLIINSSKVLAADSGDVVINELAWKTEDSSGDEWLEFYNNTDSDINLEDWVIRRERDGKEVVFSTSAEDGISLNNSTIPANGYFFIERMDTAGTESAIATSTGNFQSKDLYNFLQTDGENLTLKDSAGNVIDNVDCSEGWFAGDNDNAMSMEKILPEAESNDEAWWGTYDPNLKPPYEKDDGGFDVNGTPGQKNSIYDTYSPPEEPENILSVEKSPFFPREGITPDEAQISYSNTEDKTMYATLKIYDINGYVVKNLLSYEEIPPGEWEFVSWAGDDDYGDVLPMGIYIVHMKLEPSDGGDTKQDQAQVVIGRNF